MPNLNTLQHVSKLATAAVFQSIKTMLMLVIVLSVVSTMTLAQQDYQPDTTKLDSKAGSSAELYVEKEFNFETYKRVVLDLSVVDLAGNPVSGALLRVSVIDPDIVALTDERLSDKSLVKIARTDQFGRLYQNLELSNSILKVLLELDMHQENNKVIVELDESLHLQHVFSAEQ